MKVNDFREIIKEEAKRKVESHVQQKLAEKKLNIDNLTGFAPKEFEVLVNHEKRYISTKE